MRKLFGTVVFLGILAGVGWSLAHPRWARTRLGELKQYAEELTERACTRARRPGDRTSEAPGLLLLKDRANQQHPGHPASGRAPAPPRPDPAARAIEQKRVDCEIARRRSSRIRMLRQVLEEKAHEQADAQK